MIEGLERSYAEAHHPEDQCTRPKPSEMAPTDDREQLPPTIYQPGR